MQTMADIYYRLRAIIHALQRKAYVALCATAATAISPPYGNLSTVLQPLRCMIWQHLHWMATSPLYNCNLSTVLWQALQRRHVDAYHALVFARTEWAPSAEI